MYCNVSNIKFQGNLFSGRRAETTKEIDVSTDNTHTQVTGEIILQGRDLLYWWRVKPWGFEAAVHFVSFH